MLNIGDIISYTSLTSFADNMHNGLYIVSVAEDDWFRAIKPNTEAYILLSFDSLKNFIDKGEIEIIAKTDNKCP